MEILAIIISIFSLLVAGLSVIFTKKSSKTANELAQTNLHLQESLIELEVRKSIEESNIRLENFFNDITPLLVKEKHKTLTDDEKEILNIKREKNLKTLNQSMLNSYEDACTKYLDKKLNPERFEKNYHIEIRNILENSSLEEYFNPTTSRYKAILKVYKKWEDKEQ